MTFAVDIEALRKQVATGLWRLHVRPARGDGRAAGG